ncbi:MAG: hypothetical protein O6837_09460 [Deltaproteobacteria bacterium]|nr:hypothetical protein [Deltaproteobacteria bacterium]
MKKGPIFALVCSIHLNPLRARIIRNLPELARYPYRGHTALVGKGKYRWQDMGAVLGQFGANLRGARWKYEIFVADGVSQGRRAVKCRVREGVAFVWIEWLGHSGAPAARAVGIRAEGVCRVVERGRQQAKYWQQVLGR